MTVKPFVGAVIAKPVDVIVKPAVGGVIDRPPVGGVIDRPEADAVTVKPFAGAVMAKPVDVIAKPLTGAVIAKPVDVIVRLPELSRLKAALLPPYILILQISTTIRVSSY